MDLMLLFRKRFRKRAGGVADPQHQKRIGQQRRKCGRQHVHTIPFFSGRKNRPVSVYKRAICPYSCGALRSSVISGSAGRTYSARNAACRRCRSGRRFIKAGHLPAFIKGKGRDSESRPLFHLSGGYRLMGATARNSIYPRVPTGSSWIRGCVLSQR